MINLMGYPERMNLFTNLMESFISNFERCIERTSDIFIGINHHHRQDVTPRSIKSRSIFVKSFAQLYAKNFYRFCARKYNQT